MKSFMYIGVFVFSLISPFDTSADVYVEIHDFKLNDPKGTDTITYTVHDWEENDPRPAPSDCIQYGCDVGVAWQVGEEGIGGFIAPPMLYKRDTKGLQTMGAIARLYKEKVGVGFIQSKTAASIKTNENVCFAMKYRGTFYPRPITGNTCINITPGPPPNSCYIEGPVIIQHSNISVKEINGDEVSKDIALRCVEKADVSLAVVGLNNGELALVNDGRLSSSLYINGVRADVPTQLSTPGGGENTFFTIKSVLKSAGGISPGNYSGSASLILDVL
ncbi:TPA: hypothetical protein ACXNDR_001447 [Serratia marcescens]